MNPNLKHNDGLTLPNPNLNPNSSSGPAPNQIELPFYPLMDFPDSLPSPSSLTSLLESAWFRLRVSVRAPERCPPWDAIVLTAASSSQALLYESQLLAAKRNGRIAESTFVLAVPDPNGMRIGSGGATLGAIRSLMKQYTSKRPTQGNEGPLENECDLLFDNNGNEPQKSEKDGEASLKVLLVHAGGDSKRVPWANPIGKPFIPFPLLGQEEPEGAVYSLFDHILAVSAPVVENLRGGGLLIMTGDVLACFDSASMAIPENGAVVVTVPSPLDIATRHGVIISSSVKSSEMVAGGSIPLVKGLLQKPTVKQMVENGAVVGNGSALLDTGIFAMRGTTWQNLIGLAKEDPDPILELLESKEEMSLYEELASSWVPSCHAWLSKRPLGFRLIHAFESQRLYHHVAKELVFLHFGTSGEILDHFSSTYSGQLSHRHLSILASGEDCHVAPSAVITESEVHTNCGVGESSLICSSILDSGVRVGNRCVLMAVSTSHVKGFPLVVPDNRCLWQVPLVDGREVFICCGVEDNPKVASEKGGTFCGEPWLQWMGERGLTETDIWGQSEATTTSDKSGIKKGKDVPHSLWNACLFPALPLDANGLPMAMYLMGETRFSFSDRKLDVRKSDSVSDVSMSDTWRNLDRLSLSEIHHLIDFQALDFRLSLRRSDIAKKLGKVNVSVGSLGRNFSQLTELILQRGLKEGGDICIELKKSLIDMSYPLPGGEDFRLTDGIESSNSFENFDLSKIHLSGIPQSRVLQVMMDLSKADNNADVAALDSAIWRAVANETAAAIGRKNTTFVLPGGSRTNEELPCVGHSVQVALPVRLDLAGGWSDTPPWSLERTGRVLNMATLLEGENPVGARVTVTDTPGILVRDDAEKSEFISDPSSMSGQLSLEDPFCLVKAALLVTGFGGIESEKEKINNYSGKWGLEIETWAHVPRGSGLGTSSILAAALVKALLLIRIGNRNGNETETGTGSNVENGFVSNLVLLLEQKMGTGGGWQDQVGGLFPGIKCTTSFPTNPMTMAVDQLPLLVTLKDKLENRLVVVFTGKVRLARDVLHKVVRRYLQRDTRLISKIQRLTELADLGRRCLSMGQIDNLGQILKETWNIHQELDPRCSNPHVDLIFEKVEPFSLGYKLVGAGGGGFAIILAKSEEDVRNIKMVLSEMGKPVKVYNWSLWEG